MNTTMMRWVMLVAVLGAGCGEVTAAAPGDAGEAGTAGIGGAGGAAGTGVAEGGQGGGQAGAGGFAGDPGCAPGREGCVCYGNWTCDGNLVCASNVCVRMSAGGAGGLGNVTGAGNVTGQGGVGGTTGTGNVTGTGNAGGSGACGTCPTGSTCVSGSCTCQAAGQMLCNNQCVDTQASNAHCGGCFRTCNGTCMNSVCMTTTGAGGAGNTTGVGGRGGTTGTGNTTGSAGSGAGGVNGMFMCASTWCAIGQGCSSGVCTGYASCGTKTDVNCTFLGDAGSRGCQSSTCTIGSDGKGHLRDGTPCSCLVGVNGQGVNCAPGTTCCSPGYTCD